MPKFAKLYSIDGVEVLFRLSCHRKERSSLPSPSLVTTVCYEEDEYVGGTSLFDNTEEGWKRCREDFEEINEDDARRAIRVYKSLNI